MSQPSKVESVKSALAKAITGSSRSGSCTTSLTSTPKRCSKSPVSPVAASDSGASGGSPGVLNTGAAAGGASAAGSMSRSGSGGSAGTSAAPLARIAPTSTLLHPSSTTLQATVRTMVTACSSTGPGSRNTRSAKGASRCTATTVSAVTRAFKRSPVFTIAGSLSRRPAPTACALKIAAAMPRLIAGYCTQLRTCVAAP